MLAGLQILRLDLLINAAKIGLIHVFIYVDTRFSL